MIAAHKLIVNDSGYLFVAERGTWVDFDDLLNAQTSVFEE
jgi:hypothetical protein